MSEIVGANTEKTELHNDNNTQGVKVRVFRANITDDEFEKICKEAILLQYSWYKDE